MKSSLRYILLIIGANIALFIFMINHEKLLTALDSVKMPISDDSCQPVPFNTSKFVNII